MNATTELDLFVSDSGVRWGLSRVNQSGGRSFRLLEPEQCVDAAEAVGFVANVFAKDATCPVDLAAELKLLGERIDAVVAEVKQASLPNGETKPSGLLTAFSG